MSYGNPDPFSQPPQQQKSGCGGCMVGGMGGCLLGCLGVAVLSVALAVGGVWWAIRNAPNWARDAVVAVVNDSKLSDQDKQEIIQQVDRVKTAYDDGKLGTEQVTRLMDQLSNSPLLQLGEMQFIRSMYLNPSGLSQEEKEQGDRTLQRVARGLYEKSITESQLEPAMKHIATLSESDGQRTWNFRDKVSDEELREFLAECNKVADESGVPDEPFDIDIGKEIKRIVDEALGNKPAEAGQPADTIRPPVEDEPAEQNKPAE